MSKLYSLVDALKCRFENFNLVRTTLGMTLRPGDSIETSNGVTFHFSRRRGDQVGVSVSAPKEIKIWRITGGKHET